MASVSRKALGFEVLCPECMEAEVSMDLNTFRCTCAGCSHEFTAEEARDQIAEKVARWDRVVRWIESAKVILAEEK